MRESSIRAMTSRKSDLWRSPDDFYALLDGLYRFEVDAAADESNTKCERFWSAEDNGLAQDWTGLRIFCNPPYSSIKQWMRKASERLADVAVLLVPARTDTAWFHDYVVGRASRVLFVRGRLQFGQDGQEKPNSAPFPSMVAVYRRCAGPFDETVQTAFQTMERR